MRSSVAYLQGYFEFKKIDEIVHIYKKACGKEVGTEEKLANHIDSR